MSVIWVVSMFKLDPYMKSVRTSTLIDSFVRIERRGMLGIRSRCPVRPLCGIDSRSDITVE